MSNLQMLSWTPMWTGQVRIESGGRYPLGLNRFHDGLEDILIKSITAAANRLRYISYCCWAIGDIQYNESCHDYDEFVHAFNLRANALALGLYMMKPGYSVYGSEAISGIFNEKANKYDCSFRMMQSNDLGAYGLNYKGTIANWGLTETDEKGIVILTGDGKTLHGIIERHYKEVRPEYFTKFRGAKVVPKGVLLEWAKVNDFDNIRNQRHSSEREFYKSILFRLEKQNPFDYRRDTLAFMMECIKTCSGNSTYFTEDVLRNILYYAQYYNTKQKVIKYRVPEAFKNVHFYWSLYEGHLYFSWWLSKYFEIFLEHLKSRDYGSTKDDLFAEIDPTEFNETVKQFFGVKGNYFNGNVGSILKLYQGPPCLSEIASEEALCQDEEYSSISQMLAKFVISMAAIYLHFKDLRSDARYQVLASDRIGDLWFNVLYHIEKYENIPVKEFLILMLNRFVINQHDLIMTEKNDLRRSWFKKESSRYHYQADVSVLWRTAKYGTIMNFLSDMKLLDSTGDMVRLSKEGDTFLRMLISRYY